MNADFKSANLRSANLKSEILRFICVYLCPSVVPNSASASLRDLRGEIPDGTAEDAELRRGGRGRTNEITDEHR